MSITELDTISIYIAATLSFISPFFRGSCIYFEFIFVRFVHFIDFCLIFFRESFLLKHFSFFSIILKIITIVSTKRFQHETTITENEMKHIIKQGRFNYDVDENALGLL